MEAWVCEVRQACEDEHRVEDQQWLVAWDDVRGGELKLKEVLDAREEEVGFMQMRGIWVERPLQECWDRTGRGPVSTKWVDTNKGTDDCPCNTTNSF